jgi:hypothetical protein
MEFALAGQYHETKSISRHVLGNQLQRCIIVIRLANNVAKALQQKGCLEDGQLSVIEMMKATVIAAAIALVVACPTPSSSLLLATLIATTVVAAAIALVIARPTPSSPSPLLLPPLPAPSSSLATLVAIVIALFVASAFTCPPPSSPAGVILLTNPRQWRRWWRRQGADRGSGGSVGNAATK